LSSSTVVGFDFFLVPIIELLLRIFLLLLYFVLLVDLRRHLSQPQPSAKLLHLPAPKSSSSSERTEPKAPNLRYPSSSPSSRASYIHRLSVPSVSELLGPPNHPSSFVVLVVLRLVVEVNTIPFEERSVEESIRPPCDSLILLGRSHPRPTVGTSEILRLEGSREEIGIVGERRTGREDFDVGRDGVGCDCSTEGRTR